MTSTLLPATRSEALANYEIASEALREARKLLPSWRQMVKMLSRRSDMKVELTTSNTSCTDGKTVYIRVPIELGLMGEHDMSKCGRRDEDSILTCAKCAALEDVNITIIHEVAHNVFGSFAEVSDYEKMLVLQKAIETEGTSERRKAMLQARIAAAPDEQKKDYFNLAGLINGFLPLLVNAVEDIRVNTRTQKQRPGTKIMFEASHHKVFKRGITKPDGTLAFWHDAIPNAQAMIGAYCKVGGYAYADYLSPEVAEKLDDADLTTFCERLREVDSVYEVYRQCFSLLNHLRRLGFMLTPEDPPEPEPEPEPEEQEPEEQEQEEENEDPGEGDPGDEGQPGGEGDNEETDSDKEGSNDEAGDEGDGAGESEDESDSGADADSGNSDSDSTSGDGEPKDSPNEDGGSQGTPGDQDPNDAEGAGADPNADAEGDAEPGDDPGQGGGGKASADPDAGADGEGPAPEPQDGDDPVGVDAGEDAGQSEATEDGDSPVCDTAQEGTDSEGNTDTAPPEDEVPADQKDSAEPFTEDDLNEAGTPEEVGELLTQFTNHDKNGEVKPSGDIELSPDLKSALEKAFAQMDFFDAPSINVDGVEVHLFKDRNGSWAEGRRYGYEGEAIEVSERDLSGPTQLLRLVFQNNARGNTTRRLRSGKVDARALARRVPVGDDRLFKRRVEPNTKDYFVLIGLDCSGSTCAAIDYTSRSIRLDLIKAAAYAKAEMLSRLGIDFAVYAHSGSSGVDIFVVKSEKEPWSKAQKEALMTLSPYSGNLDGHTLEYYRKQAQKSSAEEKIILYYTDGAMPASNYHEELAILQREIEVCKRSGIRLVGVGVNSDAPLEHGLDTILLNGVEDIGHVVKELQKRLS